MEDTDMQILAQEQMKAKQKYLREEIIQKGYNSNKFVAFCRSIKGEDINEYSIEELQDVVYKFKLTHVPGEEDSESDEEEEIQTQQNQNNREAQKIQYEQNLYPQYEQQQNQIPLILPPPNLQPPYQNPQANMEQTNLKQPQQPNQCNMNFVPAPVQFIPQQIQNQGNVNQGDF